ncbi:MAG: hypothetical protein B6U88_00675 [Candidatus Aenigmarchaeota archaeon ex4484_56]|nr:MAG: hypothetical protein B6U88_00675 [Candidatus Aenigmarchaeota archaeon ex4484_56]
MVYKGHKGISPVIATILMVMITVALVGILFTWFTGMTEKQQEETNKQYEGVVQRSQSILITVAYYDASEGGVVVEVRAPASNTRSVNLTGSTYLVDNVIQNSLLTYSGGTSCTADLLDPGEACYMVVGTTCHSGSTVSIITPDAIRASRTIDNCS